MTVTSPALPATVVASAATRLRTVLRADAVVTGAVGAVAVLAAPSLAGLLGTPTVLRVIGAVLLVAAVDIALLARLSGRRLALAGTVVGELALAWVAATAVVIALGLANPAGVALLVAVAMPTAAFGVAELRLARQLLADG
jgi:hypothetical protein